MMTLSPKPLLVADCLWAHLRLLVWRMVILQDRERGRGTLALWSVCSWWPVTTESVCGLGKAGRCWGGRAG